MDTIQVVGVLYDPMNKLSIGTTIRVTSTLCSPLTTKGMAASVVTGDDGSYDFQLVYGTHLIEVMHDDEFMEVDTVVIDETTVTPTILPNLFSCVVSEGS